MTATVRAVGIDIGGTKTSAAVVDADGRHTEPVVRDTPARGGRRTVLATAVAVAREAMASVVGAVQACGVGTAGTVDRAGVVTVATDLLADWAGTDVRAAVESELGLPAVVLNDVHAAGVAESRYGAAVGAHHALVLAVGTGIGGAVVEHGQVMLGRHGQAGAVGHVVARRLDGRRCSCGVFDHIEAYASGPAMELTYRETTGLALRLPAIARRAVAGDSAANHVITDAGYLLGRAVGGLMRVVDPEVVVVGGGVAGLGAIFLDAVRAGVSEESVGAAVPGAIVPAVLGDTAAIVGAAVAALA